MQLYPPSTILTDNRRSHQLSLKQHNQKQSFDEGDHGTITPSSLRPCSESHLAPFRSCGPAPTRRETAGQPQVLERARVEIARMRLREAKGC